MKKIIYSVVALSFIMASHEAYAGTACGASAGVERNANTKYKVSDLIKKPAPRATVKRTKTTQ